MEASVVWKVILVEQDRLDELGLCDGRCHFEQRFVGEDDSSFRDRPDFAGKAQAAKRVERRFIEAQCGEISQIALLKGEVLEDLKAGLYAASYKKAALGREPADRETEGSWCLHLAT